MILVLDLEVKPDYRYLGPEIVRHLPAETDYREFVDDPTRPDLEQFDGVVLSGSTASVYDDAYADWLEPAAAVTREAREAGVPLLGICFGHQLVHDALGGTVEPDHRRSTFVQMDHNGAGVLDEVAPTVPALHADVVTEPAPGLEAVGRTDYDDQFCSRDPEAPLWTVQFHPEFTARVADRPSDWTPGDGSFEDCTATRVLDNFAAACADRTAEAGATSASATPD